VGFGPRYRQGTRLHEIVVAVILLQEAGEVEAGKRGGLVVARPFDEGFEGGSLTGSEIGGITTRDHRAAGPEDAVEVGGQKGRAIGVSAMKLKQAAVETYYFEQWRVAVGDGRVGLRLPGEKVLERTEHRAAGIEFVGVFRGDQAAFAGRGKLDRVAENLEKSAEELLAALLIAGLKAPEKAREKPVFVEHAGEIFWLNLNAKEELWVNAKASKFTAAETKETGSADSDKKGVRRPRPKKK
jgi:hypothetical protein